MQDNLAAPNSVGLAWVRIAALYLVVGIAMGIAMGATQTFTLRPVHAHVNLLGWAGMALSGLVYFIYPKAGESKLGRAHFWLTNLALPFMMVSLALVLTGTTAVVPVLAISEFVMAAGVLAFVANLFVNIK